MKFRFFFILFFACGFSVLYAQTRDDSNAARQYMKWAQQAIDEGRWSEALTALERASDFAGDSSDISYLLAVARLHEGKNRNSVITALDYAIETNLWENYSEGMAILLKADQLISMRNYLNALALLESEGFARVNADAAILQLLALKGIAADSYKTDNFDPVQAAVRFRSHVLLAMDRYPRDPRPLRIFFEYAHNRRPDLSGLAESDINLLELALKRLPFLTDKDPDLAWMAAPFIRNVYDARRLVSAYRSGGMADIQDAAFMPSPASIPAALNLGLIDDNAAVEELFTVSMNNLQFAGNESFIFDRDILANVYKLLRSEEGRNLFTQKLLSFSGIISSDPDHNGCPSSLVFYSSGVIREFNIDLNRDGIVEFNFYFSADGTPDSARYAMAGHTVKTSVKWEHYPSVDQITLEGENFIFRPADFQFAPIKFTELGGSKNFSGLVYPWISESYIKSEITRKTLISFCANIIRPSVEFDGAIETVYLQQGIPVQAVETLNGRQVSVTEFERGLPVIQHIDLDLDGRMETIRRFRRPVPEQGTGDHVEWRHLLSSSESDWSGDGRYKTAEVYLQDGSVVYSWDMDGSGELNYSETGKQ
jgi:hypothetical protein